MRAVLIVCALGGGVAHAGPVAAVKKHGFANVQLVAKGKVSLVVAEDSDGAAHALLVDGKGRVADAGDSGNWRGKVTVKVSPFFGKKSLLDVDVHWNWSNGMGSSTGDTHFILRAKGFAFACRFDGSGSGSMEGAGASTTSTIAKTGDAPLGWTITSHEERQTALPEPPPDPGDIDRVTHYTLGAKGPCATSP